MEVRGRAQLLGLLISFNVFLMCSGQVLTPPLFNLAKGRRITASATCGIGVSEPELYCTLTGAMGNENELSKREIIQGQQCDYCNPGNPRKNHSAIFAIDGTEKWWQSPPLSRGNEFNKVDLVIDLDQEFHIVYIVIKMAISPRPGVWALEKSSDYGKTYEPWQYFADNPSDCIKFFNTAARNQPTRDNEVLCVTDFTEIFPFENGEIIVSLTNGRPNAQNFSYADGLKDFMKATNVRLRFIRTKTLLGHLMAVANQDASVTRRYFYSIRDISLGGRCVCNGHANNCFFKDPKRPYKLTCDCQHNTVGDQCERCDEENGFVQKKWQPARYNSVSECEPCQCYSRATGCKYDPEVDAQGLSIDIHGFYRGGGVCQNCQYKSTGINCEKCLPGYYRPFGTALTELYMCTPCQCDSRYHINECEEETGRCKCLPEYAGFRCDRCAVGYYGYPDCVPCYCDVNGTEGNVCYVNGGQCPCKENYVGKKCDMCQKGYYNFPECSPCECDLTSSLNNFCDVDDGQCRCYLNYGSRNCSQCAHGYFSFSYCFSCACDPAGAEEEICDKETGDCLCKQKFNGDRCDACARGYYGYPDCMACDCREPGSTSHVCEDQTGQCPCIFNYAGQNCERCASGFYSFPDCIACACDPAGAEEEICDKETGDCLCKQTFNEDRCDACARGYYGYPDCMACDCREPGSTSHVCEDQTGQCPCIFNYAGQNCERCASGFYSYPDCIGCDCDLHGSSGQSCDQNTGQCDCRYNFQGLNCDQCKEGFYNYPNCEVVKSLTCSEGHRTCHSTALCVDFEEGFCCECIPPRFGNGIQCISPGQPQRLNGKVSGSINDVTFQDLYMSAFADTKTGRAYVVLSRVPDEIGSYILTLNTIGGVVGWMFAIQKDESAMNGYTYTGGKFTRESVISYRAGGSVIIRQTFYGYDAWNNIRMETHINGSVLGFTGSLASITVDDYQEEYRRVGPGMVKSFSERTYRVDQTAYVYTWDQTISFDECTGYLSLNRENAMRLTVSKNFLSYENNAVRFAMTNKIAIHSVRGVPPIFTVEPEDVANVDPGEDVNITCVAVGSPMPVVKWRQGYQDLSPEDEPLPVGRNVLVLKNIVESTNYTCVAQSDLGKIERNVQVKVQAPGSAPRNVRARSHSPQTVTIEWDEPEIPNGIIQGYKVFYTTQQELPIVLWVNEVVSDNSMATITNLNPDKTYTIRVLAFSGTGQGPLSQPVQVTTKQRAPGSAPRNVRARSHSPQTVTIEWDEPEIPNGIIQGYKVFYTTQQELPIVLWVNDVVSDNRMATITNLDPDKTYTIRVLAFSRTGQGPLSQPVQVTTKQRVCACDPAGAEEEICDKETGDCLCKQAFSGDHCDACARGYYGYPDCVACDCRESGFESNVCEDKTGQCQCRINYTGKKCERCASGFYRYPDCIYCDCDLYGSFGQSCDQDTGQCVCRYNFQGLNCDQCKEGLYNYPNCNECDCDPGGSMSLVCDPETGQCPCKARVEGRRCDQPRLDQLRYEVEDGYIPDQTKVRYGYDEKLFPKAQILVGLKFTSNTSVTLRNPPNLAQAGFYNKVCLYFKTTSENGLLLYLGSERSGTGKAHQDYMAIEVEDGYVVFKYNLGFKLTSMTHPQYVADGKWYKVIVKRIVKIGTLMVEHGLPEVDELPEVSATAEGLYSVLDMLPYTTKFYAGGLPPGNLISDDITREHFTGTMESIKFDNKPVWLRNFEADEINVLGATERDIFQEVASNGFRLYGSGYVVLSKKETGWEPGLSSQISLRMKTYADNGLVFFASDGRRDFISIEVKDGMVLYQYDLGGGRANIMHPTMVNDGEWHSVQVNRRERTGVMYVDEEMVGPVESPGTLSRLSISEDISVGGYQEIILPIRDVTKQGFEGCIEDLAIQLGNLDLNENVKAKGVIPGCPEQIAKIATFTSEELSYVKNPLENIGASFDISFKMKTLQTEALLLYVANIAGDTGMSVSIKDGMIEVISDFGDGMVTEMKTQVNTYNDGRWHYISIMKVISCLMMNIDDSEQITGDVEGEKNTIDTLVNLYFGNTDSYMNEGLVATTEPLEGCIGDVMINGEFLHFAKMRPEARPGISLSGCPIVDPDSDHERPNLTVPVLPPFPTFPPGKCALESTDPIELMQDDIRGTYFGAYPNSRMEYSTISRYVRIRSAFMFEIRTLAPDGVIFYLADNHHNDHISLVMKDGKIRYSLDSGTGEGIILTDDTYNDGKWHMVEAGRYLKEGSLQIDGVMIGTTTSKGRARSINGRPPFYFGGLSGAELPEAALKNLDYVTDSFYGCIADIKLNNNVILETPVLIGTLPCSDLKENGAYFFNNGGYIKLMDDFKVGLDLVVSVEVRPRSLDAVIFSVHGSKGNYVVLQMVKGELHFMADNGNGDIIARYIPQMNNKLCDGMWHSITAVKSKNTLTLTVDNNDPISTVSQKAATSTDTNNPFYIGGKPDSITKGIKAKGDYLGCLRNLVINGERAYLATGIVFNDVTMDGCPVN